MDQVLLISGHTMPLPLHIYHTARISPDFKEAQVKIIWRHAPVPSKALGVIWEVMIQLHRSLAWTTRCPIDHSHTISLSYGACGMASDV